MGNDPSYTGAFGVPLHLTVFSKGQVKDFADATKLEITVSLPNGDRVVKEATVGADEKGRPCLACVLSLDEQKLPGQYSAEGYYEREGFGSPTAPIFWTVNRSMRVVEGVS